MAVSINSGVTVRPTGQKIVDFVNKWYDRTEDLYVTSAFREREADGGQWSHHNGQTYSGSPTAAVDFAAPMTDTGRRAMQRFARWIYDHFGDLTVEMLHTTPFDDDNGFYVRNQQRFGLGYPEHTDHIHYATSAALVDLMHQRAAEKWGSGEPIEPVTPGQPTVGGPNPAQLLYIADLYDFTWNMGLREEHVIKMVTQEGMAGFNAKCTEMWRGGNVVHRNALHLLNVAVDAGLQFPISFIVPRSGVPASDQVDFLLENADRHIPWWRDHPDFSWQVDVEAWEYDRVSPDLGRDVAVDLMHKSAKPAFFYASWGQYKNTIPAYPGRVLWNANYNQSGARRHFSQMYIGDSAQGWVTYSGQHPSLLQYCSDATGGGWVPSSADGGLAMTVFRGTPADFRTLRRFALDPYHSTTPPSQEDPMTFPATDFGYLIWRMQALYANNPEVVAPGPNVGERNGVHFALKEIKDKLDALGAPQPVPGLDPAELQRLVKNAVREVLREGVDE